MAGFQKQWIENRGITVLRKLDPAARRSRPSKVALVLAGGAISGGGYKLGGLRALDDFLISRSDGRVSRPFGITDFDTFVGLSAGAVFASALAAGISSADLFQIIDGTSTQYTNFTPLHFMWPNSLEFIDRLDMFVRKEVEVCANWLRGLENPRTGAPYSLPETLAKAVTVLTRLIPTGLFSTASLERFLRKNLRRAGIPNHFVRAYKKTGKELYLTAVDVNTGRKIVFGHDEPYHDVPITQAVVASCGLPFWFKTVRLQNPRFGEAGERRHLDLADGGIVRTANIRTALAKGADLVVCYNPFRQIQYTNLERSLYEHGAYALISQYFRILLGTRLELAREGFFSDDSVQADMVFIEPAEDDYLFFLINPVNAWSRHRAAEHGFQQAHKAIEDNFVVLRDVFRTHGITLGTRKAERDAKRLDAARHDPTAIQDVMESSA